MSWIVFAFITAFLYALFDVFVRLTSDKMHPITAALFINTVAALVGLAFFSYQHFSGTKLLQVKEHGWLFATLAGISVGLLSMTFIRVFSGGANVAMGVTVVRASTIVIATLIGVFILQEGISARSAFGIFLSVVGIYLILGT